MNDRLLIVVRTIGERTFPHCIKSIERQGATYVPVNEKPFIRAVEKTFELGAGADQDYLLALDADVILRKGSLKKILEFADKYREDPRFFRADFRVKDKFRGKVFAGCHLYSTRYAEEFRDAFRKIRYDPTDRRPESGNIQKISNRLKLFSKDDKSKTVGAHDYGQYYSHIYTKYYNRAVRDYKAYERIMSCLREKLEANPGDHDYPVAIAGMEAGKGKKSMRLHESLYLDATPVLHALGTEEKKTISWDEEAK